MSCCAKGVFIVWKEDTDGFLREEMVNEAGNNKIEFVTWSLDRNLLCILIQAGQVVLGDVEGRRIWGKNHGHPASLATFDSDDQLLILAKKKSNSACLLVLETQTGNSLMDLELESGPNTQIVSLQSNNCEQNNRVLVCLQNGIFFLINDILSAKVRRSDRGLSKIFSAKWSPDSRHFVIVGETRANLGQCCFLLCSEEGQILSKLFSPERVKAFDFNLTGSKIAVASREIIKMVTWRKEGFLHFLKKEEVLVALKPQEQSKQAIGLYKIDNGNLAVNFRVIDASDVKLIISNGIDSFLTVEKVNLKFLYWRRLMSLMKDGRSWIML